MAIISEVPGPAVTVDVAGQDLLEYTDDDIEESQPFATTQFVEATSGAIFGVATRYDPETFAHVNDHIYHAMYLDGRSICGYTHVQDKVASGYRNVLSHVRSDLGDRMVKRRFAFAELQVNEGPADMQLWGQLKELGTITVKYFRVRYEERPAQASRGQPARNNRKKAIRPMEETESLLDNDQVPEKNLKGRAISHQAKMFIAEEAPVRPSNAKPDSRRMIFISKDPFATFHFKYRSRRALQGLCVIPRTPSPVPLEQRPIDELTPEELRALLQKQRDKEAEAADLARIKKESKRERSPSENNEDGDGAVVSERRPRKALKRTSVESTEVIDLCDDE